jgi:UDPglucose 6-dehydrogenase
MNIAIVGSGYVGLVTGACFADVGRHVICVDNDQRKIAALQSGRIPIYEPGLQEIVHRNVSSNRLRFTRDIKDGVANSQIIFIAVPTPPQADGSVDLTYIEQVAREVSEVLTEYRVVVDKAPYRLKPARKSRIPSAATTKLEPTSMSLATRNSFAKGLRSPI